ncbi:hypothetical protein GNY86_19660 [Acinetobacter baumannii]|uniref:Uncharacterized protein n=1 Tax=Acinetobacter baumannii TaxID=470 RepID=A0A6I4ILD4_ACIBA|nr:hypothetical protein [Acinetobacter baumannii]MBF6763302.1 hypothetical protein [Acinetobacter baumannii]MBF6945500.1 hypothetical protein [Acinetobacter baumannii]MCC0746507.1 hypothetical protein [Acinetobacter baumannii]MCO9082986.1 hypothetical protein [Acinetobacter baumannii]MCO9086592.1 hypothetical protein [Acinetobacter baumannii]
MDNHKSYKMRVENDDQLFEGVSLFEALGYKPKGSSILKSDIFLFATSYGLLQSCENSINSDGYEWITLPQLRDLVVLKRNDVKDATHRDKRDESIYLTSDKVIYYWQGEWCKSAINKSNDYENYIANSLTPIAQPQDPALISGAEAKLAWANGVDIQIKNVNCVNWYDLDESKYNLDIFDNVRVDFRLKPQTIKLELELPKPFEPKVGDIYWFLSPFYSTGYDHCTFANDSSDKLHVQYGAYRSEDDVKKAVEQLRKIRGAS